MTFSINTWLTYLILGVSTCRSYLSCNYNCVNKPFKCFVATYKLPLVLYALFKQDDFTQGRD